MALSAKQRTIEFVRRLKRYTKAQPRSLREIAQMTLSLEPPERMHHTHLSTLLNIKPDRNIYLQQYLMLLNVLGLPEIAMIADFQDAADARRAQRIVEVLADMPRSQRVKALAAIESLLR